MAFGYSPSNVCQNAAFWRTLLGLHCVFTLVYTTFSPPPEDPIKCVLGTLIVHSAAHTEPFQIGPRVEPPMWLIQQPSIAGVYRG